VALGLRTEGSLWFPLSPRRVLAREGTKRAGATCKARPFSLRTHQEDGLLYLRIGGDFERDTLERVQAALATLQGEPLRGIVFDLSYVTFMDLAALKTIMRVDQRGLREGFDVVVVRPPPLGRRILTLLGYTSPSRAERRRAGEHLTIVNHPLDAGVHDWPGKPSGSEGREAAIELRRLPSEEVFTCVRCRSNPAVLEAGQVVGGLTLVSPDGPICGGCVTREEQIAMGEAILADLRRGQPRDEARISELEEALAELGDAGVSPTT
jgi:anti-anti-sigma regulatory factor